MEESTKQPRLILEIEVLLQPEEVQRLVEQQKYNASLDPEGPMSLHFEMGATSRLVTLTQIEEEGPDCDPEAPCVMPGDTDDLGRPLPLRCCSVHGDCDGVGDATYLVPRSYAAYVHRAYVADESWLQAVERLEAAS